MMVKTSTRSLKSKTNEEEHEPKEKNMKIFYKLNITDNTNIASTPREEEFSNQNFMRQ